MLLFDQKEGKIENRGEGGDENPLSPAEKMHIFPCVLIQEGTELHVQHSTFLGSVVVADCPHVTA